MKTHTVIQLVLSVAGRALRGRAPGRSSAQKPAAAAKTHVVRQSDDDGHPGSSCFPIRSDATRSHITPANSSSRSTIHVFRRSTTSGLTDISWNGAHVDLRTSEDARADTWDVTLNATQVLTTSSSSCRREPRSIHEIVLAHPGIRDPPPPPTLVINHPQCPGVPTTAATTRASSATRASASPRPAASSSADPRLHLHLGAEPADRRLLRRRQAHDADPARHLHHPGARPLHDARLPPDGARGVDRRTDVGEIEHPIWTVTFRAGTYTFKCDVHASMKGTFVVAVGAPAPPRCKVPRVLGKRLAPARRAIRARHCRVGRVRYRRSTRPRGRVASQSPRAGRTLVNGARVNLVVSRGPG